MPLTMIRPGETKSIKQILGKDETRRHLESLGFTVGESVTAISELSGNLIISIKGSRIAINKTMASKILMAN